MTSKLIELALWALASAALYIAATKHLNYILRKRNEKENSTDGE